MQCGHPKKHVARLRNVGRVRTVVIWYVRPIVVLDPRHVPDKSRRTDVERLHQTSFLCKTHTRSQRCSRRDRGLGLETARDRNFAAFVLVSVLKYRSQLISRPINNWLACMRREIVILFSRKLITKIAVFMQISLIAFQDQRLYTDKLN